LHVALLRGELGRREENRKTNLRAELTSFVVTPPHDKRARMRRGHPYQAIRRCESLPSTSHSVIILTDRVQTGSA
jgi:hypothetical protein